MKKIKSAILRNTHKIINSILLKKQKIVCNIIKKIDRERDGFIYDNCDYVRLSSLELVAHEIAAGGGGGLFPNLA
ncbi:hypothetical protein AGMMS49940_18090 [Spirochaetia bacterium]|nr:hypothetical protein AGMMS49940_18090 [Spirochaetia bacterium]